MKTYSKYYKLLWLILITVAIGAGTAIGYQFPVFSAILIMTVITLGVVILNCHEKDKYN
jgi:hypothetical protein